MRRAQKFGTLSSYQLSLGGNFWQSTGYGGALTRDGSGDELRGVEAIVLVPDVQSLRFVQDVNRLCLVQRVNGLP
jgi:hypothetical protein